MLGLYTIDGCHFMEITVNLFMVLMVAESMNYFISYISNDILICMLISTTLMGIDSLSNGSYIVFKKLP